MGEMREGGVKGLVVGVCHVGGRWGGAVAGPRVKLGEASFVAAPPRCVLEDSLRGAGGGWGQIGVTVGT